MPLIWNDLSAICYVCKKKFVTPCDLQKHYFTILCWNLAQHVLLKNKVHNGASVASLHVLLMPMSPRVLKVLCCTNVPGGTLISGVTTWQNSRLNSSEPTYYFAATVSRTIVNEQRPVRRHRTFHVCFYSLSHFCCEISGLDGGCLNNYVNDADDGNRPLTLRIPKSAASFFLQSCCVFEDWGFCFRARGWLEWLTFVAVHFRPYQ
jgi:hypothetical protein